MNDGSQTATQQTPSNPGASNPAATPADTHAVVTPPVTPPQQTASQPAQTTHKPVPAPHRNPASKPAAAATGFISIASDPIATVYIDGQTVGQSPVINHEVPVGSHTIRVERVGFATQTQTVQVSSGETSFRKFTLLPGG